jgi:scyllo-inositol 2-dehydrogenase (NADP+)
MNKVKIGIIGMGRMGLTHYSIINTHPDVEIVSVSDTASAIVNALKKYIPKLKTYTDYKDLLNAKDIDGVLVTTPSILHYPICKLAGENGISVFCEKPFTTSPAQAEELKNKFEAKGLVNQVGYVYRYNALFQRTKEYIEKGVLGNILNVKADFYSSTIIKPQSAKGWRSERMNGGGVTYEMASHILDLMNYFFGAPKQVLDSTLRNVYSTNVEDILNAKLIYPGNITCALFVNWSDVSYRKPMMKLEIFGTKGKVLVDLYGMQIFLTEGASEFKLERGWTTIPSIMVEKTSPYYVRGEGFTFQLYDFVEEIKDRSRKPLCSFSHAWETQKTIHAIFDNNKLA